MSRIPCNVNKDLLPLYVDNVCSEESKSMVEEHLAGCEECQGYYDALREGIPEEKIAEEKEELLSEEKMREAEVSVIKGAKKEISKNQGRKIAVVTAGFIFLIFVLEGLTGSYMGWLGKLPIFGQGGGCARYRALPAKKRISVYYCRTGEKVPHYLCGQSAGGL